MAHIERIIGTLGRTMRKNSENCRIEQLAKKKKSIFGSSLVVKNFVQVVPPPPLSINPGSASVVLINVV